MVLFKSVFLQSISFQVSHDLRKKDYCFINYE